MNITTISHDIDSEGTTVTISLDDFSAPADGDVEVIFSDEVWEALQRFAPKEQRPSVAQDDYKPSKVESWFLMQSEPNRAAAAKLDKLAPGGPGLVSQAEKNIRQAMRELYHVEALADRLVNAVQDNRPVVAQVYRESIKAALHLAIKSLRGGSDGR